MAQTCDSNRDAHGAIAPRLPAIVEDFYRQTQLHEPTRRILRDPQQIERLKKTLLVWLTDLFMSFGLFAPRNLVVVVALLITAIAVGSSVVLIMELDDPFGGVVKVSGEPVAYSLSVLGR